MKKEKKEKREKKQKKQKCQRTSIGGQAVMEGVMMRGVSSMATAVRDADGIIRIESKRVKPMGSATGFCACRSSADASLFSILSSPARKF